MKGRIFLTVLPYLGALAIGCGGEPPSDSSSVSLLAERAAQPVADCAEVRVSADPKSLTFRALADDLYEVLKDSQPVCIGDFQAVMQALAPTESNNSSNAMATQPSMPTTPSNPAYSDPLPWHDPYKN
jgi:hypothetical protein